VKKDKKKSEIDKAVKSMKKDLKAGRYNISSVDEHIKRITEENNEQ